MEGLIFHGWKVSHRKGNKFLIKYIERESHNKQNVDFSWTHSMLKFL